MGDALPSEQLRPLYFSLEAIQTARRGSGQTDVVALSVALGAPARQVRLALSAVLGHQQRGREALQRRPAKVDSPIPLPNDEDIRSWLDDEDTLNRRLTEYVVLRQEVTVLRRVMEMSSHDRERQSRLFDWLKSYSRPWGDPWMANELIASYLQYIAPSYVDVPAPALDALLQNGEAEAATELFITVLDVFMARCPARVIWLTDAHYFWQARYGGASQFYQSEECRDVTQARISAAIARIGYEVLELGDIKLSRHYLSSLRSLLIRARNDDAIDLLDRYLAAADLYMLGYETVAQVIYAIRSLRHPFNEVETDPTRAESRMIHIDAVCEQLLERLRAFTPEDEFRRIVRKADFVMDDGKLVPEHLFERPNRKRRSWPRLG